ncbi:MAG: uroporphyrinogen-III synthase [Arenicella sp.]|jgi:uroporphyrinogen-III synthase
MSKGKSILVSRNLKTNSPLRTWAEENEHALIELPFIRIDPVVDVEIPLTDWVFFSSPNGLDIYFKYYPLLASKIGVYGEGTNSRLKKLGMDAQFVGDTSKTPAQIGEEFFDSISSNESVLFPQSQLSKKSILGLNKVNECIQKVVYETGLEASDIHEVDYAILSSPSNIDGYLLANKVRETTFIVLGETSKNHFESLGLTDKIAVPESANEEAVILLLEALMK